MDNEEDYEECQYCGLEYHWDELEDGLCDECREDD
jgi:hypothetical protein